MTRTAFSKQLLSLTRATRLGTSPHSRPNAAYVRFRLACTPCLPALPSDTCAQGVQLQRGYQLGVQEVEPWPHAMSSIEEVAVHPAGLSDELHPRLYLPPVTAFSSHACLSACRQIHRQLHGIHLQSSYRLSLQLSSKTHGWSALTCSSHNSFVAQAVTFTFMCSSWGKQASCSSLATL